MTDRYNPLVHEVNATVRMGAHPDGRYVLATEHEKTEAELATMTGAYLRVEAEMVAAKRHIWRSGAGEAFNRIAALEALLKRWYADPGVYMNDEELKTQQALIDDTVRALSSEQETFEKHE